MSAWMKILEAISNWLAALVGGQPAKEVKPSKTTESLRDLDEYLKSREDRNG